MGYIYIIRNTVNNKIYIGKTIHNIKFRFKGHIYKAKTDVDRKLYNAMREIGIDNFYIEELEECDNSLLNDREKHYIEIFDSLYNGYNSTSGGEAGYGKYEDELDYIYSLIESGLTKSEILKEVNITKEYLAKLHDFSDTPTVKDFAPVEIDMYSLDRQYIQTFFSIKSAYDYICNILNRDIDKRNFYNRVIQSCKLGTVSYEHIWRYKGKGFTLFDRDVKHNKEKIGCLICGNVDIHGRLCNRCYNKYLKYYEGMQTDEHKIGEDIKKILNIHKCKNDNCNRETYFENEYCLSCANVIAKGKSPKPNKEEFIQMVKSGMTLNDIAFKYGRNRSTVSCWKKQYMNEEENKVTKKDELSDDYIIELYNSGLTIQQIAKTCDRQVSTIRYRLDKLGIDFKQKSVILRCKETGKEFNTYKEAGSYMKTLYNYIMDDKYVGYEIKKAIDSNKKLHGYTWERIEK